MLEGLVATAARMGDAIRWRYLADRRRWGRGQGRAGGGGEMEEVEISQSLKMHNDRLIRIKRL